MKTLTELGKDLTKITAELKKLHEKDLLRIIGVEAVKIIKDNFKKEQSFTGENWKDKPRPKWVNEIYDNNKNYKGSYIKGSNPIAKQTGKLRDSNDFEIQGNRVLIGTNTGLVPYAKNINEGGSSYWKEAKKTLHIIPRHYLPSGSEPLPQKLIEISQRKYYARLEQIMSELK